MQSNKLNYYNSMNKIRLLKKSNNLIKTAEEHSRQIITKLYTNYDNPQQSMLLYQNQRASQKFIKKSKKIEMNILQSNRQRGYNQLLNFFQHFQKISLQIRINTFILFKERDILLIERKKTIKIVKKSFTIKRLIEWLANAYFDRSLHETKQEIIGSNKDDYNWKLNARTLHNYEQRVLIPNHLVMKKQSNFMILEAKVSDQSAYLNNNELSKDLFCAVYFQNGKQQLFNFGQILQCISEAIKQNSISHIIILPKEIRQAQILHSLYDLKSLNQYRNQMKNDFLLIKKREPKWDELKQKWDTQRRINIKNKNYQAHSDMITLQLIVYLQSEYRINIKSLSLQWTVDSNLNFILSNVFNYEYQNNAENNQSESLYELYEKIRGYKNKTQICQSKRFQSQISTNDVSAHKSYVKLPHLHQYRSKTEPKYSFVKKNKNIYNEAKEEIKKMIRYKKIKSKILKTCL